MPCPPCWFFPTSSTFQESTEREKEVEGREPARGWGPKAALSMATWTHYPGLLRCVAAPGCTVAQGPAPPGQQPCASCSAGKTGAWLPGAAGRLSLALCLALFQDELLGPLKRSSGGNIVSALLYFFYYFFGNASQLAGS